MLLPRFQNFPAKCPKSKIFLRNLPEIRQEKNYIPVAQEVLQVAMVSVQAAKLLFFAPYALRTALLALKVIRKAKC